MVLNVYDTLGEYLEEREIPGMGAEGIDFGSLNICDYVIEAAPWLYSVKYVSKTGDVYAWQLYTSSDAPTILLGTIGPGHSLEEAREIFFKHGNVRNLSWHVKRIRDFLGGPSEHEADKEGM